MGTTGMEAQYQNFSNDTLNNKDQKLIKSAVLHILNG